MILGVSTQVVDVERRQPRDEQLQLLLVEYRDEALGNDAVEAVEERLQLFLNGAGHLHLTNELHILFLVLLGHAHVSTVWLQVTDFRHAKLLNL